MNTKGTEIASLGEYGLIDRLTARLKRRNATSLTTAGDDAAVIDLGEEVMLLTTDMMTEGIDFDLSYFPLQHLGYKAIVRGVNDILAMNGKPEQVIVALGVSAKISVEALDALYEGMERACEELGYRWWRHHSLYKWSYNHHNSNRKSQEGGGSIPHRR